LPCGVSNRVKSCRHLKCSKMWIPKTGQ
jgi:hypothetical protein